MNSHLKRIERASQAWEKWCRLLEQQGLAALHAIESEDEVEIAEALRHLGRLSWVHLLGSVENKDARNPYFWRTLDPHLKMGGDNPQGLYLSAPINGTDIFRITGCGGEAAWMSFILRRSQSGRIAGHSPFGAAAFLPQLTFDDDGGFELFVSPEPRGRNWIASDQFSDAVLVRQFFGTPNVAKPYNITIENLTSGSRQPQPLALDTVIAQFDRAGATYANTLPSMQTELLRKQANSFETDIGDPTSKGGGVPGGNAVTARWAIEPHEALLIEVTPPTPCAYWDVQVGNLWYESFDYREFFSGLTYEQAYSGANGLVTLVLSERDPGTANWLETAHHRQGHIAIRWQLSDGRLPVPRCTVVNVKEVGQRTGLPTIGEDERRQQRMDLRTSFERRFRT